MIEAQMQINALTPWQVYQTAYLVQHGWECHEGPNGHCYWTKSTHGATEWSLDDAYWQAVP